MRILPWFSKSRTLTQFAVTVILIGGSTIGASVVGTGGFEAFAVGVFIFSLLPVIVFALAVPVIAKHQQTLRNVFAVLFLSFVGWLYVSTAIDVESSDSSTRGLDYLFLPFYVLGAVAISIVSVWALRKRDRSGDRGAGRE